MDGVFDRILRDGEPQIKSNQFLGSLVVQVGKEDLDEVELLREVACFLKREDEHFPKFPLLLFPHLDMQFLNFESDGEEIELHCIDQVLSIHHVRQFIEVDRGDGCS